jgi:aryl-alcohol dehydrogenase-like predicted oxidoreductase
VAATPLGRGMITSTFAQGESLGDDKDTRRAIMPRFQDENRSANEKLVAQFQTFADKKKCTVSQLALAWLLKQGDDIFPIPGTKRVNYLEQNWASLEVELSDEEEKEIRAFVEGIEVKGTAQPAQFAGYLYRDTAEE